MKLSQRYDIPYSIWALGSDIWSLGKVPIVRSILRKILNRASTRFADGYGLCNEVTEICGNDCVFLPSSRKLAPVAEKTIANRSPYKLAFLGRWHHNKGIDLLFDALLKLDEQSWDKISEVRIFGGGPMENTVKKLGDSLIKSGRPITIGGFLNLQEASNLYQWADYILIPSRIESIPVVFSDAMQARCPVIAMPVGDLSTLINENDVGVIASDCTSDDFKSAICRALERSPADYEQATQLVAKKFSPEQAVSHFLDHLKLNGN